MIDDKDSTNSTLRLILWRALMSYSDSELITMLSDSDCIVRTSAAKRLHFRPSQEVFFSAITLCKSKNSYERDIGAFVLGQLGTPKMPYRKDSIRVLSNLITDCSPDVRSSALCALGHLYGSSDKIIKDESLISRILESSKDKSADVRFSCAFALNSLEPSKRVLDVLDKLKKDKNRLVREWAELAEENIGSKPIE